MFAVKQPSMALNDTRLDVVVQMTVNKKIQPGEGVSEILGYVVNEAKKQLDGRFKTLVFNCHAKPGELQIGAGIIRSLTDRFSVLAPEGKPLVDVIYLRSCYVARIDGAGSDSDGNLFCSAIAKNAKCMVVASTALQTTNYKYSVNGPLPFGMLDKYEGTTLLYEPGGSVRQSATNPMYSTWRLDRD